ncbi:polysaccharide pyruvyl transferase family protein [Butyrivibrio sp. VCB2006]|uniref:polysaccharide pyruvyl transferase family protein n=1 Tax=Butyrivibrio sp. VCB2006 TaxID=1280679 RepID=UPI000417CCE1|nr:polysaccharide pyruvyl transferase family protein [Butyrivibrio sp. VCB2006]
MQKKIGIITFHNSVNYGAALQTYALYKTLSNDGYDVEVIDYVNEKIDGELKSKGEVINKSIKGYVKAAIKKYHGKRKFIAFSDFNESRIKLSDERNIPRSNVELIANKYDVFITGSDQVWNLGITGGDLSYYLDFVPEKASRIAYAASAGDTIGTEISKVLPIISKFNAISVREKSLKDYLGENFNLDTTVCCDPTLLAEKSIFSEIKSKRLIKKKYVFCFLMADKPGIMDAARAIAKEKGLVLIDNKKSFEFFLHSSPEDYLSWICNAEYVLTDSFHGTVFSLIFNKQFISDKYDADGNVKKRIQDLLGDLSLEDHFKNINLENIECIKKILYAPIDYEKVEKERKELASKSHDWLMDSIKNC